MLVNKARELQAKHNASYACGVQAGKALEISCRKCDPLVVAQRQLLEHLDRFPDLGETRVYVVGRWAVRRPLGQQIRKDIVRDRADRA